MGKTWTITATLLFGLMWVIGCSSGDSPTASTPVNETTGTRSVEANPSFANDIQEIFQRRGCTNSSCHGTAVSANLDLREGTSYNNLVNVQATAEPIIRVIPSNADGSYLVIKLEGRQSVGGRMPQGGQPLDQTDLTNIKNWINQGAQNN
jgi:hypothetical protein